MSTHAKLIPLLVFTSGLAALSWEVLWQLKAALALGVSAWGTALTLSITMGGMSAGALLMGQALRNRPVARPLRLYGLLEIIIGISGLCLAPAFRLIESLDTWAYATHALDGIAVHFCGIILALTLPAMAMGATMPVLGLIARQTSTSVAGIYGLNTLGAALGTLAAALFFIPSFGILHTAWIIACINFIVGIAALVIRIDASFGRHASPAVPQPTFPPGTEMLLVGVTGFSIFMLEVAWFRSLTAAYHSTSAAFAVMLAAVLLALGLAARIAPWLKRNGFPLGLLLGCGGVAALLVTPVIERFDLLFLSAPVHFTVQWVANKLGATLLALGIPVLLIGVTLPWILDEQNTPRRWGVLYGLNALCAIIGSLCAAWIFLPHVGFAKTAWLAGTLIAIAGILTTNRHRRALVASFAAALIVAVTFQSGIGKTRAQGEAPFKAKTKTFIEAFEGPDVTASVMEFDNQRVLLIDGFAATWETVDGYANEHYMIWMGHLPMLLYPEKPEKALVICFGTGQTANAVRRESPKSLDIVDINSNVFRLARHFDANENVLADPRVNDIVMDGRAFIRRTDKTYDIITLEPMPPTFAGVNALYSREFYELALEKMSPDGVIAQWLPFHLVDGYMGASIAKTFQSVFPNAILWADPQSRTGILLGSRNNARTLAQDWPGFHRVAHDRTLTEREIRDAVIMDAGQLQKYAAAGNIITDDNQALSYRKARMSMLSAAQLDQQNWDMISDATGRDYSLKK